MDPNNVPDPLGDALYRAILPLAIWYGKDVDADHDYALKTLCYALAKPFAQVWELAMEDEGRPPWDKIVNLDTAPDYVLPYIAQYVGARLPVGASEAEARELISSPTNMDRGTPWSIRTTAERNLTGTKFTLLRERDESAYHFTLVVRTAETDLASGTYVVNEANSILSRLIRALYSVKPAGLRFDLVVTPGITIDELVGDIDDLIDTIDEQI